MSDERDRGGKLEVDPPNTSEPPRYERETVHPQSDRPGARAEEPSEGAPSGGSRPAAASTTNKPLVLAILYLTSCVVGLTGLVAFILALVWKSEPGEAWEASHYDYHIMTFLLWFGATVLGLVLIVTIIGALIGIPMLFGAVVWVLVRAIVSLIRASNREPMPNPGTWLA